MDEQLKIFLFLFAVFAVITGYVLFQGAGASDGKLQKTASAEASEASETVFPSSALPERALNVTRFESGSGEQSTGLYGDFWRVDDRRYGVRVEFSSRNGKVSDRVEEIDMFVQGNASLDPGTSRVEALKNILSRETNFEPSEFRCSSINRSNAIPVENCLLDRKMENGKKLVVDAGILHNYPASYHVLACVKTPASNIYNTNRCLG